MNSFIRTDRQPIDVQKLVERAITVRPEADLAEVRRIAPALNEISDKHLSNLIEIRKAGLRARRLARRSAR